MRKEIKRLVNVRKYNFRTDLYSLIFLIGVIQQMCSFKLSVSKVYRSFYVPDKRKNFFLLFF